MPVPVRLQFLAYLTYAEHDGFAPGIGGTAFVLLGPLELGLSTMGETQVAGYSRAQFAVHAGARLRSSRLELDLAGTFGGAAIYHAGEIFGDRPDAGGTVSFVGGRAGASLPLFVAKGGHMRFGVGLALTYEYDLSPYRETAVYSPYDDWYGDPARETSTYWIGTQRGAVQVAFMFGMD